MHSGVEETSCSSRVPHGRPGQCCHVAPWAWLPRLRAFCAVPFKYDDIINKDLAPQTLKPRHRPAAPVPPTFVLPLALPLRRSGTVAHAGRFDGQSLRHSPSAECRSLGVDRSAVGSLRHFAMATGVMVCTTSASGLVTSGLRADLVAWSAFIALYDLFPQLNEAPALSQALRCRTTTTGMRSSALSHSQAATQTSVRQCSYQDC